MEPEQRMERPWWKQIEETNGGMMEGIQSKRTELKSATRRTRNVEYLMLTKNETTLKTNHIL